MIINFVKKYSFYFKYKSNKMDNYYISNQLLINQTKAKAESAKNYAKNAEIFLMSLSNTKNSTKSKMILDSIKEEVDKANLAALSCEIAIFEVETISKIASSDVELFRSVLNFFSLEQNAKISFLKIKEKAMEINLHEKLLDILGDKICIIESAFNDYSKARKERLDTEYLN